MSKQMTIEPHQYFSTTLGGAVSTNTILELVDVFSYIYMADISTKKSGDAKRRLIVNVPVQNVALWKENAQLLSRLIAFVSGDELRLDFHKRTTDYYGGLNLNYATGNDNITLLSGGLDSYCGAYRNIQQGYASHYISYKNSNKEVSSQNKLTNFFGNQIKGEVNHYKFRRLYLNKSELTQRTRCLLYLALAVLTCGTLGINSIKVYENGILSLNPSFKRRSTTKSTHPKTIFLFNLLLQRLNLGIVIDNPFLFLTKGQIVNDLNNDFKANISLTTTCSSNIQNPYLHGANHCGFCVPCVLRKISMTAANLEHYDANYQVRYSDKPHDTENSYINNEYRSSLAYFSLFKKFIDDGSIYNYLEIHSTYFNNENYYTALQSMLDQFSKEIEEYFMRYELY